MSYFLLFLAGALAAILYGWLWDLMTGQTYSELEQKLDRIKAGKENELLVAQFLDNGLPDWSRREIVRRMKWFWAESRALAYSTPGVASFAALGFVAVVYTWVWCKTWVVPNSSDLRLLMGCRALMLQVARKKEPDEAESGPDA